MMKDVQLWHKIFFGSWAAAGVLTLGKYVTWAARISFLRILPEIGGFCGDRSSRVHTSTKIFGKLLGK